MQHTGTASDLWRGLPADAAAMPSCGLLGGEPAVNHSASQVTATDVSTTQAFRATCEAARLQLPNQRQPGEVQLAPQPVRAVG
jgi:hypothetical protein